MAVVTEIIRVNEDRSLSFGDYTLRTKTKVLDFEVDGRFYKAKTFNEVTKLKRDGALVYESIPGTVVHDFMTTDDSVNFKVEGDSTTQITLELQPKTIYKLMLDGEYVNELKTSVAGKVSFSVEANKEAKLVSLVRL